MIPFPVMHPTSDRKASFAIYYDFLHTLPQTFHLQFRRGMTVNWIVDIELPASNQGARHLYMCYLRPFFLRHQARVDQVVGSAYGEMVSLLIIKLPMWLMADSSRMQKSEWSIAFPELQVRLTSARHAEIRVAKTLFTKIMTSGKKSRLCSHFHFASLLPSNKT